MCDILSILRQRDVFLNLLQQKSSVQAAVVLDFGQPELVNQVSASFVLRVRPVESEVFG